MRLHRKYHLVLLAGCILALLQACTKRQPVPFSQKGIAFIVPADWKITEEDSLDGEGYYLSIEKRGLDESGLVAISMVNDSLDLPAYIDLFKESLEEEMMLGSKASYTPLEQKSYANIDAISTRYKFTLMGLKHTGRLVAFYGKEKTVLVLEQCATEDLSKTTTGYASIENTFGLDAAK